MAFTFVLVVPSLPANATSTCAFDGSTATLAIDADDVGTFELVRNGSSILWEAADCAAATVDNTDSIEITLPEGSTLVVDLGGGGFGPGLTNEGDGSSEIEIELTFKTAGFDFGFGHVTIEGSEGRDSIEVGADEVFPHETDGVNLNADEAHLDQDLQIFRGTFSDSTMSMRGHGGDDLLAAYRQRPDGIAKRPLLSMIDIEAGPGDDVVGFAGRAGTIDAGTGSDTLDQGPVDIDFDIFLYVGQMSGTTINVPLSGVENATSSTWWESILVGDDGPNILKGGDAPDQLYGMEGDDQLLGQGGDDELMGLAGDDTIDGGDQDYSDGVSFGESPGGVTVSLGHGTSTGEGDDVLIDIERVAGSPFDDVLTGTPATDFLTGLGGDDLLEGRGAPDSLSGRGGDDHVLGGEGADWIEEGMGDDTVDGGRARDLLRFPWLRHHGLVVRLDQGWSTGAGHDQVRSIEIVWGSSFDDVIVGTWKDDQLAGNQGRDRLFGRGGTDELWGDQDNDHCDGGDGHRDTASDCEHLRGVP
ncbi:MAG: calcium-binding protein [Actinomycetota bacterium]